MRIDDVVKRNAGVANHGVVVPLCKE